MAKMRKKERACTAMKDRDLDQVSIVNRWTTLQERRQTLECWVTIATLSRSGV